MARTVLKGRNALIVGVDTAIGRSAAQQLSRAGMSVILCSRDNQVVEDLLDHLLKKQGDPSALLLPDDPAEWDELFRYVRDRMGHIHCVVNAHAFTWTDSRPIQTVTGEAARIDKILSDLLLDHGPTRLLTVWPQEEELPVIEVDGAWHGVVVLGPRQRLDGDSVADLERDGGRALRAGAVGDALVMLLQLPPSACPGLVRLDAVPSTEKKGKG